MTLLLKLARNRNRLEIHVLNNHCSIPCTHPHIQTNGQPQSRERRSLDIGETLDCSTSCQVQSFQVNLSSILPYVIVPTTYNAGICGGSCERNPPEMRSSLPHTYLVHSSIDSKTLTSSSSCLDAVVQRYCIPTGYRSMAVIILLESGLEYRVVSNMVVNQCDCVEVVELQKLPDGSGDTPHITTV